MRKSIFILSTILIIFSGCNDRVSYSELQDREKDKIRDYLDRNDIEVVKVMPKEAEWKENIYYKSESGLYFHLVSVGDATMQIKNNSIVSVRFILTKIDEKNTLLIRHWDPQDFLIPEEIKITDLSYNPNFGIGIQEALKYMKNYKSEAIVILESALNTNHYKNTVTPVKYRLKITAIK